MRSIAKISASVAAVSIGAVALVGCSSGGSAASGPACEGNWIIASMEAEGETVTAEQMEEMKELGMDLTEMFTLSLEKDGKAVMNAAGTTGEGTWEGKGSDCAITIEGETITAPLEDDQLVLSIDGSTINFKRSE